MSDITSKTTDDRHICDYPVCSVRGAGHPLACNCRSWQPIATAPEDGTTVWTYTAAKHGLPAFQGPCAHHPDAGWCTDELREVTHWVPLNAVYLKEPPDA